MTCHSMTIRRGADRKISGIEFQQGSSCTQFHQQFTCAFIDDILAPKIYKAKQI